MSMEATGNTLFSEKTLVDTDVHLVAPPDMYAEYMEKPHSDYMLSDITNNPGRDFNPFMGEKIDKSRFDHFKTPDDLQAFCDEFHIDEPLVNTLPNLPKLPQTDLALALMRAHNDLLVDRILDRSDFKGLAGITNHRPEEVAEEIDRMGQEEDIVGLFAMSTGASPPWGDPAYDPIYKAAQDNDLPVAYHGGAAGTFRYEFPRQNQGFETYLEVHPMSHLWSQTMTVTSLIVQGVPDKFPDLDFVILEAGCEWVPHLMFELNKEYSIRRHEAPLLTKSPEEYIRDQFVFGTQPLGEPNDPTDLQKILEVVGAESLVFASDYPHWDFDHPNELTKHLRSAFTEEEQEAILGGNAIEVFGLD